MKFLTQEMLDSYLAEDPLRTAIESSPVKFTSDIWMQESAPKRMVFSDMYGDLLDGLSGRKTVLDIGAGITCFTPELALLHDYYLVELLAHEDKSAVESLLSQNPSINFILEDWSKYTPEINFDLVIANDLFPNVDQRLGLFLDKFLPVSGEIRISLTYYNHPRDYTVRRVDGDEIFTIQAFDGIRTKQVLEKYLDRIVEPDLDSLLDDRPSLYPNGRLVCLIRLMGDLS